MDPLLNLILLKPKVSVSGIDNTEGTWCKRQSERLLVNSRWAEQLCTHFYGTMMKQDPYLHILSSLHFTDNRNEPDRTDKNTDRLWKIWDLSEIPFSIFSKFYNSSKNLAVDEVIVSFKEREIFKQHTKEMQAFRQQNFQILWLDWPHVGHESIPGEGQTVHSTAQHMTATHATVTELTRKTEACGHKLYMVNLFPSPELFDD